MNLSCIKFGFTLLCAFTVNLQAQDIRCFKPTDANANQHWSYGAVHFKLAGDLAKNMCPATWDEKNQNYVARVPKVGTLKLTATQQSMAEGNAIFSARIWTADQDYACVVIETRLHATVTAGYRIIRIDAATQTTQLILAMRWRKRARVQQRWLWVCTRCDYIRA